MWFKSTPFTRIYCRTSSRHKLHICIYNSMFSSDPYMPFHDNNNYMVWRENPLAEETRKKDNWLARPKRTECINCHVGALWNYVAAAAAWRLEIRNELQMYLFARRLLRLYSSDAWQFRVNGHSSERDEEKETTLTFLPNNLVDLIGSSDFTFNTIE